MDTKEEKPKFAKDELLKKINKDDLNRKIKQARESRELHKLKAQWSLNAKSADNKPVQPAPREDEYFETQYENQMKK